MAMAEERFESPVTVSGHNVGPRRALEWLKRAKNGWIVQEIVANIKIAIPMVSLPHSFPCNFIVFVLVNRWPQTSSIR